MPHDPTHIMAARPGDPRRGIIRGGICWAGDQVVWASPDMPRQQLAKNAGAPHPLGVRRDCEKEVAEGLTSGDPPTLFGGSSSGAKGGGSIRKQGHFGLARRPRVRSGTGNGKAGRGGGERTNPHLYIPKLSGVMCKPESWKAPAVGIGLPRIRKVSGAASPPRVQTQQAHSLGRFNPHQPRPPSSPVFPEIDLAAFVT